MSSRLIDSAFSRSRNDDSSAVSQPVSMCTCVHSPASPPRPWRSSQGLSLPSVCTFSCKARKASRRAAMSASLPDSRFTVACASRRCSSSAGTWSDSSCRRACATSSASAAPASCATSDSSRARSGACKPWRSPVRRSCLARNWRDCSSTLRDSAASTWICCCTCATSARCVLLETCALRTASSNTGKPSACSSACAASRPESSSAVAICPAMSSSSTPAEAWRSVHCAFCACNSASRACARWRPSTT